MSFLRAALGGIALLVFLDVGSADEPERPQSEENATELSAEDWIRAALRRPTVLKMERIPLNDLLEEIAIQHDVRVVYDEAALAPSGIDLAAPIDPRPFQGCPTRNMLNVVFRQLELRGVIQNRMYLVTTADRAEKLFDSQIYAVGDLLAKRDVFGRDLETLALETESLELLLHNIVEPDDWDGNGGRGKIEPLKNSLLVWTTFRTQESVAGLLDALGVARLQQLDPKAAERYRPVCVEEGDDLTVVRKVHEALRGKVSGKFTATPMDQIARELAAKHGVPVVFHDRWLADAGMDAERPVTMEFKDCRLELALRVLFQDDGLKFYIADGLLQVAQYDWDSVHPFVRVYPVRDLVVDVDSGKVDLKSLAELIYENVSPDNWERTGGAGTIAEFENSYCLVIRCTEAIHGEVERFLADLRRLPAIKEPPLAPPTE